MSMPEGQAPVITPGDILRLMEFIAANSGKLALRDIAIFALSFGAGLRVGEISGLIIRDVLADMADVNSIQPELRLRKVTVKGGERGRTIPLTSPRVRAALSAYLAWLQQRWPPCWFPDAPLIRSHRGAKMSGNVLQMLMKDVYREAGFGNCRSHSGRRTFATELDESGASLRIIQNLLGHVSINTTAVYIDTSPYRVKKAMQGAPF